MIDNALKTYEPCRLLWDDKDKIRCYFKNIVWPEALEAELHMLLEEFLTAEELQSIIEQLKPLELFDDMQRYEHYSLPIEVWRHPEEQNWMLMLDDMYWQQTGNKFTCKGAIDFEQILFGEIRCGVKFFRGEFSNTYSIRKKQNETLPEFSPEKIHAVLIQHNSIEDKKIDVTYRLRIYIPS